MMASVTLAGLHPGETNRPTTRDVVIGPQSLRASLHMPRSASALIVFAYGDEDAHLGARNLAVVEAP
jgi:hypothetical protein